MNDLLKREIDLIDCYRLAVDFGMPAAEKVMAVINESLEELETVPMPSEPAAGDSREA